MRTTTFALISVLLFTASSFASDVIEDAIKLTSSGVNEQVIVAWASKQHTLDVTVKNIVALKDGKVSERVILELINAAEVATEQRSPGQVEITPAKQTAQAPAVRYEPTYDNRPTYVPSSTYVSPSVAYYYDGYPYYRSYYYGYPYYGYPYYYSGGYYPGLYLGFSWGNGHGYGYRGYGYGYRGGYGHGGYGYHGGGYGYHGGGGYHGGTGYHGGGGGFHGGGGGFHGGGGHGGGHR